MHTKLVNEGGDKRLVARSLRAHADHVDVCVNGLLCDLAWGLTSREHVSGARGNRRPGREEPHQRQTRGQQIPWRSLSVRGRVRPVPSDKSSQLRQASDVMHDLGHEDAGAAALLRNKRIDGFDDLCELLVFAKL